jgi:23S rRNA (cytosine1962-C5)-methyltransferase
MIIGNTGWKDYELLDSGGGKKTERFGDRVLTRIDPRAIWNIKDRDRVRDRESEPNGDWKITYDLGEQKMVFKLQETKFGHVGVFPEQADNWMWICKKCKVLSAKCKVLNLFGYTGGATMAAALAGAVVTHVDASKPAINWAAENARNSQIAEDRIRWIHDDAVKFVSREIKRGSVYDGIIMDPPRFGRGASGEVWKLEDDLAKLVWNCKKLLSPTPVLFLINAYTADLSSITLGNLLTDVMGAGVESGELVIKESSRERFLPAGILARWG